MNWSITGDRPVYLQLIEQMERAIVAGEYRAGARLPGVRELAAEAAVNPNTMQRALQELEARGLVNTQRTAGRTVTDDDARIAQLRGQLALRQASAFLNAMRALGYEKPETLALLEGLKLPCTDAPVTPAHKPGIAANTSGAFAGPSVVSASTPDAAANASRAFASPSVASAGAPDPSAGVPNVPANTPGLSANASNRSANIPNNPTHETGRK